MYAIGGKKFQLIIVKYLYASKKTNKWSTSFKGQMIRLHKQLGESNRDAPGSGWVASYFFFQR